MATASNRSPSPICGRRSPNLKSPESNSSIRKSFSGSHLSKPSITSIPRGFNPVTPVNSPAEFPRRNSISKDGIPAVQAPYEKENGRDQNCSKLIHAKSPVTSKGSKNFMAPTISAASKVTPSPRKKVLTERNESVRTSIPSPAEGKSVFPSMMNPIEIAAAEEIGSKSEISFEPDSPKISEISFEPRKEEVQRKENLASSPLPLSPSHADPPLPPYDPKTNYLSPRPQFLRYRPNARIEIYLNREKDLYPGEDCRHLDDSSASESRIEETQSPETQKGSDCSFSSEIDPEDGKETTVSNPESDISDSHEENPFQESVEVEEIPRLRSFARPKFLSLLLVLAIACFSVSITDSPVLISPPSMIKYQSFDEFYTQALQILKDPDLRHSLGEIVDFANTNLERAVYRFRHLTIKSATYLFNAISPLRGEEQIGVFHFGNITSLVSCPRATEMLANANQIGEIHVNEKEEKQEDLEVEMEGKMEQQALYKECASGNSEHTENDVIVEPVTIEEQWAISHALEHVLDSSENSDIDVTEELLAGVIEEQSSPISHPLEIRHASVEMDDITQEFSTDSHVAVNPLDEANAQISDSGTDTEAASTVEALNSVTNTSEEEFSRQNLLGISSIFLTLIAIAALFYLNRNKTNAVVAPKQHLSQKKMAPSDSVSASSDDRPYFDRTPSYDNGPVEVEMAGESGPCELSSNLQKSSSRRSRRSEKEEVEVQSYEKKSRRNSNYSSSHSPSYGSFTTYEKIQSKQGCGEEETVTPVRRSSRLRKQITSP